MRAKQFIRNIVRFLNRNDDMEIFFGEYQFIRKAIGGRWERWWVEVCGSYVWMKHNSDKQGRVPCAYGTPIVEEWL